MPSFSSLEAFFSMFCPSRHLTTRSSICLLFKLTYIASLNAGFSCDVTHVRTLDSTCLRWIKGTETSLEFMVFTQGNKQCWWRVVLSYADNWFCVVHMREKLKVKRTVEMKLRIQYQGQIFCYEAHICQSLLKIKWFDESTQNSK